MNVNLRDIYPIQYGFPDRENYRWSEVVKGPDISDRKFAPKKIDNDIEYAQIPVSWSKEMQWIRTSGQVVFSDGSRLVINFDGTTASIIPPFDASDLDPYYKTNWGLHDLQSPQDRLQPRSTTDIPFQPTIQQVIWMRCLDVVNILTSPFKKRFH